MWTNLLIHQAKTTAASIRLLTKPQLKWSSTNLNLTDFIDSTPSTKRIETESSKQKPYESRRITSENYFKSIAHNSDSLTRSIEEIELNDDTKR